MSLFDWMPVRDIVSWNTMISGYAQCGRLADALGLFNCMPERNIVSLNAMITGFLRNGDESSAIELFQRMLNETQCGNKDDHGGDLVSAYNILFVGYGHRAGDITSARSLFDQMMECDTFSSNTMISGYVHVEDMLEAIELFTEMPSPDTLSWNTMISGFAQIGRMELADDIFKQMSPKNLVTCGAILEAETMFKEVHFHKDVISWNAMIRGYASHGFASEALEHFNLMEAHKVQPSYITFILVLNACAHAGLVEEGRRHFKSMTREFGLEPRVEHFASLVDIVGRHRQLEEALDLINGMPFEPDAAVWGALLGSCRVHNNIDHPHVAAEALMRLQPESSAPYVLLYNMYADAEQWDKATEAKMLMERNNVKKEI
ncbi:E motif [Dillenia turbinata]|uniref:E motif n=1 Tax=Dillenia turbinata TaxID=194707 RepID=A0AAN8WEI8_9MAGN